MAKIWSKWPNFDPPYTKNGQNLTPYTKKWPKCYPPIQNIVKIWSKMAKIRPPYTKNGQNLTPLYKKLPKCVPLYKKWPKFDPYTMI